MKYKYLLLVISLFIGLYVPNYYSQIIYTCTLANDAFTSPKVYEFDIYMVSKDTTTIELAGVNFGFTYNSEIQDTGKITAEWVPKSSELTNLAQLPNKFIVNTGMKDSLEVGIVKIGPRLPVGHGNGSIISTTGLGTKIGRLRLTNSVNYISGKMNIEWNFLKTNGLYPTTITVYINQLNTSANSMGTFGSKLNNPEIE